MSSKSHLDAIASRRTIYSIGNSDLPIPRSRIEDVVAHVIKHTPSPYNIQTARAVIVYGDSHKKLWANIETNVQQVVPKEAWEDHLGGFVAAFKNNALGSVVWFEDQDTLSEGKKAHPAVEAFMDSWSTQSSGMHQINAWTALEVEGLGASLQHLHFHPATQAYMQEAFGIPESWKCYSQIVFGVPTAPAGEKTFKPIQGERLKVFS